VNRETGESKWELVEITFPWPWIDFDGQTLEKAYRKKVSKYDVLRQELKKEYPHGELEQVTIVVCAT
jgi:predicted metalloenzyme YecM